MASSVLIPTAASARPAPKRKRRLTRWAFHVHLWLGVLLTVALVAIAVTGVLLNHKRGLGLMPDVPHEPTAPFVNALALEQLARVALEAAPAAARGTWQPGDPVDVALIDRMDVRPRDGFVKVRLRDKASTEMTVDLATGAVLHAGRRGDVFLEKLHSGEIFGGQPFVILSDIAAIALVLTLITGYWLWMAPRLHRSGASEGEGHA
ncbi:MAG TPA: PepSY-associated TM helix domain-containing protein [Gemmatimonadaceae bacterium]